MEKINHGFMLLGCVFLSVPDAFPENNGSGSAGFFRESRSPSFLAG
jgi:hypothetical protein